MTIISTETSSMFSGDESQWARSYDLPMSTELTAIHNKTSLMRDACGESLQDLPAIEKLAAGNEMVAPDHGMGAVIDILIGFSSKDRLNLRTDQTAIEARNLMEQLSNIQRIASRSFQLKLTPRSHDFPMIPKTFVDIINQQGNGWVTGTLIDNHIEVKILTQAEFAQSQQVTVN